VTPVFFHAVVHPGPAFWLVSPRFYASIGWDGLPLTRALGPGGQMLEGIGVIPILPIPNSVFCLSLLTHTPRVSVGERPLVALGDLDLILQFTQVIDISASDSVHYD
jgi:hypothetical protein